MGSILVIQSKHKQQIITLAYEIVMGILALSVLVLLVLEYTIAPTEQQLDLFAAIDMSILAVFAVDYLFRLYKAQNKALFFKSNIFDLIAIIPVDKAFRIARLARLTRFVRLSRLGKATKLSRFIRLSLFARKFMTNFNKLLKTNGLHYMIGFTSVIVLLGAVGIMQFESAYGEIKSFGDALWWSLVTTTTVGYGDMSPVSPGGRLLAGFLMIVGIGFLGMVTGSIATYFVDRLVKPEKTQRHKSIIAEQLDFLKHKLDELNSLGPDDLETMKNLIDTLWMQVRETDNEESD